MDRLGLIEANGWGVGPVTVRVGLAGRPDGTPLTTPADIVRYASERLADDDAGWILPLAILPEDASSDDVLDALSAADSPNTDELARREQRKWLVLDVEDLLNALPDDYVEGLHRLTELWLAWELPADAPHRVQTRTNMSPSDYYRQDTYDEEIARHWAWRDEVAAELRSNAVT